MPLLGARPGRAFGALAAGARTRTYKARWLEAPPRAGLPQPSQPTEAGRPHHNTQTQVQAQPKSIPPRRGRTSSISRLTLSASPTHITQTQMTTHSCSTHTHRSREQGTAYRTDRNGRHSHRCLHARTQHGTRARAAGVRPARGAVCVQREGEHNSTGWLRQAGQRNEPPACLFLRCRERVRGAHGSTARAALRQAYPVHRHTHAGGGTRSTRQRSPSPHSSTAPLGPAWRQPRHRRQVATRAS